MEKVELLNTNIDSMTRNEFKKHMHTLLGQKWQTTIAKINADFLSRMQENADFKAIINNFDLRIADGSGVLWAAKFLSIKTVKNAAIRIINIFFQAGITLFLLPIYPRFFKKPIVDKIPGIEALYLLLEAASETQASVYFFGTDKKTLNKAIKVICDKFPKLLIAGYHDGYNFDNKKVLTDIIRKKADILVVSLGSPKQEKWINDNKKILSEVKIIVGEGGTLNRIANRRLLAPKVINTISLEWLWRLLTSFDLTTKTKSTRLNRTHRSVLYFIYQVVRYKIEHKE